MKKITTYIPEMDEDTKPLFQTREFHGYWQYLETFEFGSNENYCWRFYICGFNSDNSKCHILKWDQTEEIIPIDEHSRILVNSKRYHRRYWNH